MSEIKFVLKSFFAAVVLIMLMQIEVGQATVESHAEVWIRTAPVARYLQGVADGAIRAGASAKKTITDWASGKSNPFGDQKASRWNLEIPRSRSSSEKSKE